jgi:hypothetical protein
VRPRNFNILLAIVISVGFLAASIPVFAMPVGVSPNWPSPAGTNMIWGAGLFMENSYMDLYFGARTPSDTTWPTPPAPPSPPYQSIQFAGAGAARYVAWARGEPLAPQSYTYYVQFNYTSLAADNKDCSVWVNLENTDTLWVPQDYSVILENTGVNGIGSFNMRLHTTQATGVTVNLIDSTNRYATLYVDNAVNIRSITVQSGSLTGNAGDPVGLWVDVKNTGRKADTYSVSQVGSADPVSTGLLNPGDNKTVLVNANLPTGNSVPLYIQAAGSYAKDIDFVTATGVQTIVFQTYTTTYQSDTAGGIAPWENYGYGVQMPEMVAKHISGGAVVASAMMEMVAYEWNAAGYPSAWPRGAALFDITFQWMVPGASKIIWYDGDNVYSGYKTSNAGIKKLLDNLRLGLEPSGKTYTIDNQELVTLDNLLDSTYDILVLNQEQLYGSNGAIGGNPEALSAHQIQEIDNWVAAGKGVIVLEVSDYNNYDYCRVSNEVLDSLGFGWWFQHDTINDVTQNDLGASYKPLVVRVAGNPIGDNFLTQTGYENILAYRTPTLFQPNLSATVTSPNMTGPEDSQIIETITIKNTGNAWDNYTLSVSDTYGWTSTANLSSTLVGPLNPGDNTSVTLTINIPDSTAGLTDQITIQAQSFDAPWRDNFVGYENIGPVQSKGLLIEAPEGYVAHVSVVDRLVDPAFSYDPLTFGLKVTNNGPGGLPLDQKYELSAWWDSDNSQAGLKLTPDEMFVPYGDAEFATLSVTLPDNWLGGQSGQIDILAQGVLAENDQEPIPNNLTGSITVYAESKSSVEKEILPDELESQTGAPNSPLVWMVVVKNTGNIEENLTLTVSDNASPTLRSWNASFDDATLVTQVVFENVLPLNGVAKRTAYLYVTVPGDAKTGEWDNITVTVDDGLGDNRTDHVIARTLQPGPRIPEGTIEIAVEAQVVAITVTPLTFDFGVLDEGKTRISDNASDYPLTYTVFTVRNTGNVNENILARGTDAQSMPGEPVTTWTLSDSSPDLNVYMLGMVGTDVVGTLWLRSDTNKPAFSNVAPTDERTFSITIETPTAITTPARMWARIKLTAIPTVLPH